MLFPRIIPCLLVKNKGLVKTVQFSSPKYVGDPINAVRIFNEKEVDELMVLDIDASAEKRTPDMSMIRNLAAECRMPLCYGGGIVSADQVQRIISLGVEKVAISAAAIERPQLIAEASRNVGNQSVVVVIDIKRNASGKHEVYTHNGQKNTAENPIELARRMEKLGAGEIVINSIDNDGLMKGYDYSFIRLVRKAVRAPVTALGGAGSLRDIERLISDCEVSGAAAGSLFVFKGAYRAVLISYPRREEKEALWEKLNCRD